MPLPESGPLTLWNIQSEFGLGSAPVSMSEYYSNGSYVPKGTEGINGPIPSSGTLEIRDFYGAPRNVGPGLDVDVVINSRRGPDTDIWGVGNGGSGGYEYTYPFGSYAYGSIAVGNDTSSEGWALWGFSILQQKGGGPWIAVIHMDAASAGNRRFRIVIDGGNMLFDTNSATGSGLVDMDSAIGPVQVWEIYWSMSAQAEFWTDWISGTHHIFIESI